MILKKINKINLFTMLLTIFSVTFSLSTLTVYITLYASQNIGGESGASKVDTMLSTALVFPNSLMLIPLIGGAIVDAIGPISFLLGVQVTFAFGTGLAAPILLTSSDNSNDYYLMTFIEVGSFLIGSSYQLIRITCIVLIAQTYFKRNDTQMVEFVKSLAVYIFALTLGYWIPNIILRNTTNLNIEVFAAGWIMNFLALLINTIGYFESERLSALKNRDKRKEINAMSQVDEEDLARSWIIGANELNETAKTVGTFMKDVGWLNALNLLGLGVLQCISDYGTLVGPINSVPNRGGILLSVYCFGKLFFAIIMIFIDWNERKVQNFVIVLYLSGFLYLLLAYLGCSNIPVMLAGYTIVFALQQPLQAFQIIYHLNFDLSDFGKNIGVPKWVSTTIYIFGFNGVWESPLVFGLIYFYSRWKERRDMRKLLGKESIDSLPSPLGPVQHMD